MEEGLELTTKHKGLVKDTDRHGNDRYYFRRKGFPKVRLREPFNSPAFLEELRCAQLGIPYQSLVAPKPAQSGPQTRIGSLRWLCLEYLRRGRSQWGEGTQERKQRTFSEICDSTAVSRSGVPAGELPYAGMQLKHVALLRDEKAHLPNAANRRVKDISALFNWAIGTGLAKHNPADKCGKIRVDTTAGFHTWTVEEIAQYQAHHPVGSKADLWLRMLLFTGLRRDDAAMLGRQHVYERTIEVDGEMVVERRLKVTPSKTRGTSGVVVDIPLLAPLAEAIDALPKNQMMFMAKANGEPFSENVLGNYMRKWCDKAGLPQCTSHGLRKAGAVIAAEGGATTDQLQAIFGWTTPQQAAHYTRAANRQRLASEGAKHLTLVKPKVGH